MTTKEYLSQAYYIEQKIKRLKDEVEECKRLAASIPGCNYDAVRVDGTRNTDAPFVKWIIRQLDKEDEIKKMEERLAKIKSDILLSIEKLDDSSQRMVLMYRYLEWLSWDAIAEKIYASRATVKRIHAKAIEFIKIEPQ